MHSTQMFIITNRLYIVVKSYSGVLYSCGESELQLQITVCMILVSIMLSKRSQTLKSICLLLLYTKDRRGALEVGMLGTLGRAGRAPRGASWKQECPLLHPVLVTWVCSICKSYLSYTRICAHFLIGKFYFNKQLFKWLS